MVLNGYSRAIVAGEMLFLFEIEGFWRGYGRTIAGVLGDLMMGESWAR